MKTRNLWLLVVGALLGVVLVVANSERRNSHVHSLDQNPQSVNEAFTSAVSTPQLSQSDKGEARVTPKQYSTQVESEDTADVSSETLQQRFGQKAPPRSAPIDTPRYPLVWTVNGQPFTTFAYFATNQGTAVLVQYFPDGPIETFSSDEVSVFAPTTLSLDYWKTAVPDPRSNGVAFASPRRGHSLKKGGVE